MKALILAGGYLKDDGFDVVFFPEFVDLDFDGRPVTAIQILGFQIHEPSGVESMFYRINISRLPTATSCHHFLLVFSFSF
jgi:hypothetical protein